MPHQKPFSVGGIFRYLFLVTFFLPFFVSANSIETTKPLIQARVFALETVEEFAGLMGDVGVVSGTAVHKGGVYAQNLAQGTATEFVDSIAYANKKLYQTTNKGIASAGDAFVASGENLTALLLEGMDGAADAFADVMMASGDAGYEFGVLIGDGFNRLGSVPEQTLAVASRAITPSLTFDVYVPLVIADTEIALRESGAQFRAAIIHSKDIVVTSTQRNRGELLKPSNQLAAVNAVEGIENTADSVIGFFQRIWDGLFGGEEQTYTPATIPPAVIVTPTAPVVPVTQNITNVFSNPTPAVTPVYIPSYITTSSGLSITDLAIVLSGLRNELLPKIELAMERPRSNFNNDDGDDDVDLSGYLPLSGGTLSGALSGTDGLFSGDISSATLSVTGSTTLNGVEYLFPSADGGAGEVLTTDSNGGLSWSAASGGITSLGGLSGASQTFASSSDTNIGITIVSSGTTHTFTPSWIGTLAAGRGGTGTSTVNANELLIGNAGGTAWTTIATSSLGIISDHGGLTGLTDDDHTQYALLAGRSGGQTLVGGTGASESLTFNSTAHGTKGRFKFVGSGVNGSLSVTDSSGAAQFNFFSDDSGSNGAKIRANQFVATNGTFFLAEDFATFRMSSAGSITFASGVSATDNAADIGFARSAAGILRITDGGSGGGALLANYFTATSTTATSTFAGAVGIGTTTPASKLTLSNNLSSGNIDAYSEYQALLYDAGSAAASFGMGVESSTMWFNSPSNYKFYQGGSTVALFIEGSTGEVGIGTDSPQAKLSLGSSVENQKLLLYDSGNNRYGFGISSFEMRQFVPSDGHFAFGKVSTGDGSTFTTLMTLDATTGNLGVGSTTPSTKLVVSGGVTGEYFVATSTTATSTFYQINIEQGAGAGVSLDSDTGGALVVQSNGATARMRILTSGNDSYLQSSVPSGNFYISGASGADITGNVILQVGSGGKVGIGTTTPYATLSVAGDVAITGGIYDSGASLGSNGMVLVSTGTGLDWVSTTSLGIGGSSQWTTSGSDIYYDTGNVGIGTDAPGVRAHIREDLDGAELEVLRLQNGGVSSPSAVLTFYGGSGEKARITGGGAGVLKFGVGASGTEAMSIDSTGNVGIGSSTPTYKLSITPTSSTTPAFVIGPPASWLFTNTLSVAPGVTDSTSGKVDLRFGSHTCASNCGDGAIIRAQLNTIAQNQPPIFDFINAGGTTFVNLRFKGFQNSTDGAQTFIGSDQGIFFSNATAAIGFAASGGAGNSTDDVALSRDSAGILKVTDGGTALGALKVSYLTATSTTATSTFAGAVGVGTTTPSRTFSVTGTVALDGLVTGSGDAVCIDTVTKEIQYNSGADTCLASSIRFKHDVENLGLGLSDLRELRAVSYKENATGEERIGFIAEEVEDVDERLMFYEPDGDTPRGVRYEDIVALVVRSIQEIADRLDTIEDQLAAVGQGVGNFVDLIVEKITADEVQTEKLCIGETCITESELQELLDTADIDEPPVDEEPENPPEENPEDPPVEGEESPTTEESAESEPEEAGEVEETPQEEPQPTLETPAEEL